MRSGRTRTSEASAGTDISHIPSCAMSLRQAEGLRSGERNEGLPARVVQNRDAPNVSEGGVILHNVSDTSVALKIK